MLAISFAEHPASARRRQAALRSPCGDSPVSPTRWHWAATLAEALRRERLPMLVQQEHHCLAGRGVDRLSQGGSDRDDQRGFGLLLRDRDRAVADVARPARTTSAHRRAVPSRSASGRGLALERGLSQAAPLGTLSMLCRGPFSSVSKPVTSEVSRNRTGSCSSSATPVTAPVAQESGKRCYSEATTDAFLAARRDRSLNFLAIQLESSIGGDSMMRCIVPGGKSRMMLRVGVSLAAIALAAPALARDKVVRTPVPAADQGEFRAFVEGGAFWTAGNAIPYTAPGFEIFGPTSILPLANGGNGASLGGNASLRPRVGWDAAVGFDYRFAGTPWHVNMQARGGEARGSAAISAPPFSQTSLQIEQCCDPPIGIFTSDSRSTRGISNTSAELKESHWQADFGMGYDFVPRLMQINFGVRVAEVRATTTATTNASATATHVTELHPFNFVQTDTSVATASDVTSVRRSFFGAGPRVGLEGSVPLIGPLGFDYSTNAALLFGTTKITSASNSALSNSSTLTTAAGGVVLFTETFPPTQTSLSNGTSWSSSVAVYNFDIQGGVSWWFSPTFKLGLSYRLDAFIDPLRAAPDDGRLSRYYHGPKLTLTGRF